MIRLGEKRK